MLLNEHPNPRGSDRRPIPPGVFAGISSQKANSTPPPSFKKQDVLADGHASKFDKMVLLVEDETSLREIMVEWMVQRLGFEKTKILQAPTLAEALEKISAHAGEIGLVVTDLSFPKEPARQAERECGILLIRAIRSTLGKSLPILAQSSDKDILPDAQAAGASAVMCKMEFGKKFNETVLGLIG